MGRWTVEGPQRLSFEEPVERLTVRLISGRLNVVGTDGPARLEVSAVGKRPIYVSQDGDTLTIEHEHRAGFWSKWFGPMFWAVGHRQYQADVSVAVPPRTRASLRLVSGSLVASALWVDTDVVVTNGRVTLLGLAGRTGAKVVSGPVEALGVGGEVNLETVSGELVVADSAAGRVFAKTVSGSITADLDNPPDDSNIRLETISGEITVRVREDSDLNVHLHAVSGRVTSAFAEVRSEGMQGRLNSASGVLGAGAGRLRANAISGNVSLLRRPVEKEEEASP